MTADDSPSADDEPTTSDEYAMGDRLEDGIMVASALLLVVLVGYVASQAIVAPSAPNPNVTIESVERAPADKGGGNSNLVTVSLRNDGETGLDSVEVVVACGTTERSLVFRNVPARGHRTGTVVCPRGETPTASVATWIEA